MVRLRLLLSLLFVALTLASPLAWQWAWAWPPRFGAEFTFTNEEMLGIRWRDERGVRTTDPSNRRALKKLEKELARVCARRGDCKIVSAENKHGDKGFRVSYSDGWWFQFTPDVAVVEVQIRPSTVEELRKHRDRMQRDIFETARSLSLFPHPEKGGGHIHMDLPGAFGARGEEAELFRNFFVDQANSDRALRVFEPRKLGPRFRDLGPEAMRRFEAILRDFDSKAASRSGNAILELATRIRAEVYAGELSPSITGKIPESEVELMKVLEKIYYQSFNLDRIERAPDGTYSGTVEFRALPAQRSADEFLLETELIQSRVDHLRKKGGRVAFLPGGEAAPALESFEDYVRKTGLDPGRFRPLAEAARWQAAGYRPSCPELFGSVGPGAAARP